MKRAEFERVKNMSYHEYCDYLQEKYGLSKYPYTSPKSSRVNEGLFLHHIAEDVWPSLSAYTNKYDKDLAEYQQPEMLVYCDYLEHLFLHYLICADPDAGLECGVGGVSWITQNLHQIYSGKFDRSKLPLACAEVVKDDKDVYLDLLKMIVECAGEVTKDQRETLHYYYTISHWCNILFTVSVKGIVADDDPEMRKNTFDLAVEILHYVLPYDKKFFKFLDKACAHKASFETLTKQMRAEIAAYIEKYPQFGEKVLTNVVKRLIKGEMVRRPIQYTQKRLEKRPDLIEYSKDWICEYYRYSPEVKIIKPHTTKTYSKWYCDYMGIVCDYSVFS